MQPRWSPMEIQDAQSFLSLPQTDLAEIFGKIFKAAAGTCRVSLRTRQTQLYSAAPRSRTCRAQWA